MRTSVTLITIALFGSALTAQAQPSFTSAGVVNAASLAAGPIAPGELVTINGSNLGSNVPPCYDSVAKTLPTSCNGVVVLVNGQAAPILNSFGSSLTFQVPSSVTGTTATLQVSSQTSGQSALINVAVAPTAPGLYSFDGSGAGKAYYFTTGGLVAQYSNPVQPGTTVHLFGTGFGVTNPPQAAGIPASDPPPNVVASVTLSVGGQAVVPQSTNLQSKGNPGGGTPGNDEVVFVVPSGLTGATAAVTITVGGVQSKAVNLLLAPTITSISPNPVPLSTSPQTVVINGTGFQSGAGLQVRITGASTGPFILTGSQVTFVSQTALTVQLTTGTLPGTWTATVFNPDQTTSNVFQFTTAAVSATTPTITSVVNGASYGIGLAGFSNTVINSIQSGSWVSITGQNLAATQRIWKDSDFIGLGNNLPTSLDNVSVTINNKPAAIYFISQTQLNVQAPTDASTGSVQVVVKNSYGISAPATANLQTYSPAFFVIGQAAGVSATAPLYVAAVHFPDGALVAPIGYYGASVNSRPAKPGDILYVYATGFGPTNPPAPAGQLVSGAPPLADLSSFHLRIAGASASIIYAGLVVPGEYQFNITVPPAADGDQTITADVGGVSSQPGLLIPIKN